MAKSRKIKIALGIVVGIAIILALLWYYQQQGFLKIFPTAEDWRIRKILTIDRSKFTAPNGLTQEKFEEEIAKLQEQKKKVLASPQDPVVWFNFGYTKEFLNDHQGAALAWEEAFKLQPLNFVTASNLGNVYEYFLKDYPKSEDYYLKAIAIKPDLTVAYQGLADLYRFNWKEKQDKLEPLLLGAIKADAPNEAGYYSLLVEFFAGKNDLPKAKEYLNKLQSLKPESAQELKDTYPVLK